MFLSKTYISAIQVLQSDNSRCKYWVFVSRWWRAKMAEGSKLSCLSLCMGMLAQVTLRDASSKFFPAGPHSYSAHTSSSSTKREMPADVSHIYSTYIPFSICLCPYLDIHACAYKCVRVMCVCVCMCVHLCMFVTFFALKDQLIRCTFWSTLINILVRTWASLPLKKKQIQT